MQYAYLVLFDEDLFMSNEQHKVVSKAMTMICYEDRVALSSNSSFATSLLGMKRSEKTFAYESLSSVEFEEATLMRNGLLKFVVDGDQGQGGSFLGIPNATAVSYTHLTLPTKRIV